MSKKILGILLLASQFMKPGYSCNYKLLELEADSLNCKLVSSLPISKELIQESLSFLHDKETLDKKYYQKESFEELCKKANEEIKSSLFLSFSENCISLFEQSSSIKTKAAIHILFEEISKKYIKVMQIYKKHEEFRKNELLEKSEDFSKRTSFSDADKVINSFFKK